MEVLTVEVLRSWARTALAELGRARAEIDELNVYPVPDGDTGTNLYLTWEAACDALPEGELTFAEAVQAFGRGALLGARGNSGVITSQLIRACGLRLAEHAAAGTSEPVAFADALVAAADAAYGALAQPVEGTMLTVARAAAAAAQEAAEEGKTLAGVCLTAVAAARRALTKTTDQLEPLRRAGVVDAGGAGLVVILGAMESVLSGKPPAGQLVPPRLPPGSPPSSIGGAREGHPIASGVETGAPPTAGGSSPGGQSSHTGEPGRRPDPVEHTAAYAGPGRTEPESGSSDMPSGERATPEACESVGGPAYEVMYLLEAPDEGIGEFRRVLANLGDSVVVVGGDGLWNVHVHTDDVGAAVERGIEVGRPYRIRVTHFADQRSQPPVPGRAVIAVTAGPGLAELFSESGAIAIPGGPGRRCSTGELLRAIEQSGAPEIVLLPNDKDSIAVAEAAATAARQDGIRVAVIPTRAQVQGLAAVAVHDPDRSFDDDVVHQSAAAGQTRHGAVTIAVKDAWTMAGLCRVGDALGVVDGDFALITPDLESAATGVVDRLLGGGGELLTLVTGREPAGELVDALVRHVRRNRKDVDVVVYDGGQDRYPLLIGVE